MSYVYRNNALPNLPGGQLFSGTWTELRELTTTAGVQVGSVGYCESTRGMVSCLFADASGSIWAHVGAGDPAKLAVGRNHWNGWNEREAGGPANYVEVAAAGAGVSVTDLSVNAATNPGLLALSIDGTLNSRAGVRTAGGTMRFDAASQVLIHHKKIRATEEPTDATGDFDIVLQLGSADAMTTSVPSDFAGFALDGSGVGPEILGRTSSGGADTDTVGAPLAADAWFELLADVGPLNGVPTARFVVNGILIGSHTTNIPADTIDFIADTEFIRRQAVPVVGAGLMTLFQDFSNWEIGAAA